MRLPGTAMPGGSDEEAGAVSFYEPGSPPMTPQEREELREFIRKTPERIARLPQAQREAIEEATKDWGNTRTPNHSNP